MTSSSRPACLLIGRLWGDFGTYFPVRGGASVPAAGVVPSVAASADKAAVEMELATKSVATQRLLTGVSVDHRHSDLLENCLVLAAVTKLLFAPSCGHTPTGVHLLILLRKTHCVYIGSEGHLLLQVDQRQVIVKVAGHESRVNCDAGGSSILVGNHFFLALRVPLSASDHKALRVLDIVDTVSCCQDHIRTDQAGTALVLGGQLEAAVGGGHFLLFEDSTHVRPLAELCIGFSLVLDIGKQAVLVSGAASRLMLFRSGRRSNMMIRILAADFQLTGTLGHAGVEYGRILGRGCPKPDVDQPCSVGDDVAIPALIVLDTLVAEAGIIDAFVAPCVHADTCTLEIRMVVETSLVPRNIWATVGSEDVMKEPSVFERNVPS